MQTLHATLTNHQKFTEMHSWTVPQIRSISLKCNYLWIAKGQYLVQNCQCKSDINWYTNDNLRKKTSQIPHAPSIFHILLPYT